MAGRPDVEVVTVFTGVPRRSRMLTTYDENCGFRSAGAALRRRWAEDEAAMRVLAAGPSHRVGLVDHQYEPARDLDDTVRRIALSVHDFLAVSNATTLIGPVGVAHPDHVATAGGLAVVADTHPELDVWLYEDMPSRVLYPLETHARLDAWRERFPRMRLDFLGTGPRDVKEAAVACYRSQMWALDPPTYLVPERMWRLRPCD